MYLILQMLGGAISNPIWGWLGDRFGNRTVIIGTTFAAALTPAAALLAVSTPAAFLVVFAGIGATISGVRLGYGNLILELASVELRPTCVALQNTLLAPVTLMPLVVAGLLTVIPFEVLLALGVVIMLIALIFATRVVDPRLDPAGECFEPDDAGTTGSG